MTKNALSFDRRNRRHDICKQTFQFFNNIGTTPNSDSGFQYQAGSGELSDGSHLHNVLYHKARLLVR
jgi:hypothetical protein